MEIYLIDTNSLIIDAWQQDFVNCDNVHIIHNTLRNVLNNYDIECVVSPANSYGHMTGGFDLAIINYFGDSLQNTVYETLNNEFSSCQPVGTSILINIPETDKKLIHSPTMETPSIISDYSIISKCMYSVLTTAEKNNINSLVIPAFGGSCGRVPPHILSSEMFSAYKKFKQEI